MGTGVSCFLASFNFGLSFIACRINQVDDERNHGT